MSQEVRNALALKLWFQRDVARSDILDPQQTSTYLIELLTWLVGRKWNLEILFARSGHHDDSALAPGPDHIGTHWGGPAGPGWAVDVWPLYKPSEGAWLSAGDQRFQDFLEDVARAPCLKQIGLAGSALTIPNQLAAGRTCFADSGDDHVHIGAKPPCNP